VTPRHAGSPRAGSRRASSPHTGPAHTGPAHAGPPRAGPAHADAADAGQSDVGPPYVGVVGAGGGDRSAVSARELELAMEVGEGLAHAGAVLLCGGLGGVMEAACKGASEAGGITVGLLPHDERDAANRYVRVALATGLGELRNGLIVRASDVLIAIGGGWGTLSEIALAMRSERSVITLASWESALAGRGEPYLHRARDAREAVRIALAIAEPG
jgi:uncharacterized protein (TIGR00725 family)